jgi:hypothetical protein
MNYLGYLIVGGIAGRLVFGIHHSEISFALSSGVRDGMKLSKLFTSIMLVSLLTGCAGAVRGCTKIAITASEHPPRPHLSIDPSIPHSPPVRTDFSTPSIPTHTWNDAAGLGKPAKEESGELWPEILKEGMKEGLKEGGKHYSDEKNKNEKTE